MHISVTSYFTKVKLNIVDATGTPDVAIKVGEIIERAEHLEVKLQKILEKSYITPTGATPLSTLSGLLNTDIKKSNSRFVKVKHGCFSLNPNFKEIKKEKKEKPKKREIEQTVILMGQKIRYIVKG